jgi:two-component system, NtrC family, sensor histidine kinase HydH
MPLRRSQGRLHVPLIIGIILSGAVILSLLFLFFWQKFNQQVEVILRDQFNEQQLVVAKKVADNVEAYFDFLKNALLGYVGLVRETRAEAGNVAGLEPLFAERFERHRQVGVLELRWYNAAGVLELALSVTSSPPGPGSLILPEAYQHWARNPDHRGKLFLSKTFYLSDSLWQHHKVMRFLAPLYWQGSPGEFAGVVEFLVDPFSICQVAASDVRSGKTGYPWIIDQDEIMLFHYETDFVGKDAIGARIERNPNIAFKGLKEIHALMLQGKEGTDIYESGWHRHQLGLTPKLAAYTPIRFQKGLIRGRIDLEDPEHNLWGVAVVAPVEEVSGKVGEVLHQVLFLVGLFFLLVLLASGGFIIVALGWNKVLNREIDLKTEELLKSRERLVQAECFAAVGEAAAYVSHEIKNPLMVIGGLARQVERRQEENNPSKEKLRIVIDEIKRLENFLNELKDFTRPAQINKKILNLNDVIEDIVHLMEDAAHDKDISLIVHLKPQLPAIMADPNQLKQVFVNLIKNALEAMDFPGKITITSGITDGQVFCSIEDTGKGIRQEELQKIFHPFFTTKDKGTGLGLAVIHKIVTDHHGTISVSSTPEKGTYFIISLPMAG